jgi:hypothetical protein
MLAAQGSKSSAHIQVQRLQVLQYADAMCRLFCAAITATRQHVRPVRYGVQARRMEGSSALMLVRRHQSSLLARQLGNTKQLCSAKLL